MSDWISVEDRLPDEKVPVLATNAGSKIPAISSALITWEEAEGVAGWCWSQHSWGNLYDTGNYEFDSDYTYTHWMPLPEPPKEVSGDE